MGLYGNGLGITLASVKDGASNTIIMGERAVSNNLYGWPYCGYGDGTGNGDNLLSTQLGLYPGVVGGKRRLPFLELPSQPAQFRLGRRFRACPALFDRFQRIPGPGDAGRRRSGGTAVEVRVCCSRLKMIKALAGASG